MRRAASAAIVPVAALGVVQRSDARSTHEVYATARRALVFWMRRNAAPWAFEQALEVRGSRASGERDWDRATDREI